MNESCGGRGPSAILPRQTVTVCNRALAPGADCGSRPFLALLHRRITDRIAWPWARDWLASHGRLELAVQAGWPVLRLILDTPPPDASLLLLQRHYRDAASGGKGAGPLADLAASLEAVVRVVEVDETDACPFPEADDIHDAAHDAARAIETRLIRRGLALAPGDFDALRDAIAQALQAADVVER